MMISKYLLVSEVSAGAFGRVWKAIDIYSGEVVAIKELVRQIFHSREECLSLTEIQALKILKHPNIVSLKEVFRVNTSLYSVFEYLECNLLQVLRSGKDPFLEDEVRKLLFQVFRGLLYMHEKAGYFHRDLKPDNLLVSGDLIKIGDMGFAKKINPGPPHETPIMALWYRPPEVLLGSQNYSYQVDLWAMGLILAELLMLGPLFPGRNVSHQLSMMCRVLGSPTMESWSKGLVLASCLNYQFLQFPGANLSSLMPSASEDAISLIKSLCSWDPSKRPTASETLKHPFFQSCYNKIPPSLPDLNNGNSTMDDHILNENDKILETPIGKSKYGPIGKKNTS